MTNRNCKICNSYAMSQPHDDYIINTTGHHPQCSRFDPEPLCIAHDAELARVKAESLRVVPVGEECEFLDLPASCVAFTSKGKLYFVGPEHPATHPREKWADAAHNNIVQPVRLEPWEAADADNH